MWYPYKISGLLATLKARPDLSACVYRLEITPYISNLENLYNKKITVELIQLCKPSLRSALPYTDWQSDYVRPLIYAFEGHNLHTLEILGTKSGIGLQTVIDYLDAPTLRNLRARRYGCLNPKFDNTPGMDTFNTSDDSRNKFVHELTDRAGQGSITSLTLNENTACAQITQALIAWPIRLIKLELNSMRRSYISYYLPYTAPQVQVMLEPHSESLEELTLGIMKYKSNDSNF